MFRGENEEINYKRDGRWAAMTDLEESGEVLGKRYRGSSPVSRTLPSLQPACSVAVTKFNEINETKHTT